VNFICTQIAKLEWQVKDQKRRPIKDNLYRLLNTSPNEEMTAFNFKTWLVSQAITAGNAYAEIERDTAGRVKYLWPIETCDVCPTRTVSGKLVYRIIGGSSRQAADVYLQPRDVLHIRSPLTFGGISGIGVIPYATEILGISLGGDKFANSLMANGGRPSGVLSFEGALDDEAYERIKESWKESHGGRKSGGVAILEEGAKYTAISFDPQVMQFIETRKFNVIEISRFLGVPPTKLYDTEAASYANQEQSALEVVTDTLDSWAKNLESEIDFKLINDYSRSTQLDLYGVFRGDMSSRATYFQKMMQAGAITPNEIREKEGMPGYEGGDRFFIASNNFTPTDRLDEVIDAQVAPAPTPQPTVDPKKEGAKDTIEEDKNLALATIEYLKTRTKHN